MNESLIKELSVRWLEMRNEALATARSETRASTRVCTFLDNAPFMKFTASQLAELLGVSASTVRKVVKVQYGLYSQREGRAQMYYWKGGRS